MTTVKPIRRPAGTHADYSHDSFHQQRREEAQDTQRFGWNWPDKAKNRLIAKFKALFGSGMGSANAEAQFPKPPSETPLHARARQPAVKSAQGAKKQVPPAVQRLAQRYMEERD